MKVYRIQGDLYSRKMKILQFSGIVTVSVIFSVNAKPANRHDSGKESLKTRKNWFGIYPGTLWCGPGSAAVNDDQLAEGAGRLADICCRKHDHCPYNIRAYKMAFGIFNFRPYTMSYCECDLKFRDCLLANNDLTSLNVGTVYFNKLYTPCFKMDGKVYQNTFPVTDDDIYEKLSKLNS
ncbi:acidic phospholipase A2 PA4-like [Tubulanus polymorphus]|uniref:acidic phospholipase A2 PA4-like n=1 Tax=Tubulanus polymorphus TaxID=672921 RepID=UPI003DA5ED67